jgi:ankyrin repeat protein
VADYLLEQNVDPECTWQDGFSGLTKAAFYGHLNIVKLLVEKYQASLTGMHLHAACHSGHVEVVVYLLDAGCSPKLRDAEEGTPLHSAAYNGHVACCTKLIEAGADWSVVDMRGALPLHNAARNGHVEVLKLLLDSEKGGADVADRLGMKALHHAVGHPKCVELLIERKFGLDDQDSDGNTPLHRAVSMNKVADAILLIKAGASLDLKDKNDKTPLKLNNSMMEELADVLAARARLGNMHQFDKAVELFNEKPKNAIKFLQEEKLVREGEMAADIAEFLSTAQGLDSKQLGEYISEPGDFASEVLHCYLSDFQFTGQTLEQAVRSYLIKFRLPGEAQRIDRVMQGFAARFYHDNPDMFSHEDTAYLLAFSMIMLQTDAHNPAIKREKKMTKQQFLQNNRKIDQGQNLPDAMLGEIYDNIITHPIKMETGMEMTMETEETAGLLRLRAERGRWAKQWVILRENCIYYFVSEKEKQPQGIIPLENLEVRKVKNLPLQFEIVSPDEGQHLKACKMESGMLVPDNTSTFQFECSGEQEADQWCAKIRSSIVGNPVKELLATRRKQQMRNTNATMQFSESASSHLGPQLQLALQMCVAASKGEETVLAEYPDSIVRDPHGMLRYYVITNQNSKSKFIVLVSHLWRDMDDCESWEQSPTSGRLLEICTAMRKNQKEIAGNLSPLSGYPYRNMARKAFEMLCDDLDSDYGLFVVAHGISGPMAPIIARALIRSKYKVRKVLTFGQPAVFTQRGAEKHSRLPYFRITHQRDVVPCLFQNMHHAGTEIMLFDDDTVTIVPAIEREEEKGLPVKVISTTLSRARQICEIAEEGTTLVSFASDSEQGSSVAESSPVLRKTPLSPKGSISGNGSLKGGSLATLMLRESRPSFSKSNSASSFTKVNREDMEKCFQDLLWEENRIHTYASLLVNPDSKEVVLFDSKRNEL